MHYITFIFLALQSLSLPTHPSSIPPQYHLSGNAQGTTWKISYYADSQSISKKTIDSIFNALDLSLSIYKPNSSINIFNQTTTSTRDTHLLAVIRRSLEISKHTQGLFDITIKPLVDAWGFGVQRSTATPRPKQIRKLRRCVGPDLIVLKVNEAQKKRPCVQIDVNGIAQGYSVDVIASFLTHQGINQFLVEIGGEIRIKGRKPTDGSLMRIGIESPSDDPFQPLAISKIVAFEEGAITTSGSYRKYYESEGKKISHIINPVSGYPVQNDLISVTVFAKDAITADGYDNALMLMGLHKALRFVEANKEIAAHFIYLNKNGGVSDTSSTRFSSLLQ